MAITLQPKTEEQLREVAQREGRDVNDVADALMRFALEWDAREWDRAVEGIRRGLADSDAGRVTPAAQVVAEIKAKYGIA